MTCAAFSIKFAKTNQKFAENSKFCEKNSLLLVNYSLHSLIETEFGRTRSQGSASGLAEAELDRAPEVRVVVLDVVELLDVELLDVHAAVDQS